MENTNENIKSDIKSMSMYVWQVATKIKHAWTHFCDQNEDTRYKRRLTFFKTMQTIGMADVMDRSTVLDINEFPELKKLNENNSFKVVDWISVLTFDVVSLYANVQFVISQKRWNPWRYGFRNRQRNGLPNRRWSNEC